MQRLVEHVLQMTNKQLLPARSPMVKELFLKVIPGMQRLVEHVLQMTNKQLFPARIPMVKELFLKRLFL